MKTSNIMGKWGKISAIIGGVCGGLYFPATLVFSNASWVETILVSSTIAPMFSFLGFGVGYLVGGISGFVYSVIIKAELDFNLKIDPHHPISDKSNWIPYTHISHNGERSVRSYYKYAIFY